SRGVLDGDLLTLPVEPAPGRAGGCEEPQLINWKAALREDATHHATDLTGGADDSEPHEPNLPTRGDPAASDIAIRARGSASPDRPLLRPVCEVDQRGGGAEVLVAAQVTYRLDV